jgi:predicted Zn finger-like uncharacterized protein
MGWPFRLSGKNHSPIEARRLPAPTRCPSCDSIIRYVDVKKRARRTTMRCPKCGAELTKKDLREGQE